MAFDAGSVVGHFDLDSSGWSKGARDVTGHNANLTKSIFTAQAAYDAFKKVLNFAVNTLKDSVMEFKAAEQIAAQTTATLKSTGYAAGLTAKGVSDLAGSLSTLTGVEDDTIQSAENLLLTFTNIGGTVFPDAMKSILDVSTAMKVDLQTAARQVGRALNDPAQGMSALSRMGVQFTDVQKKLVKEMVAAGETEKAQGVILDQLKMKFGGSAAAARDTFGGALMALENNIGNTKEALGSYVATVGRPFIEMANNMAVSVQDFLASAKGMSIIEGIVTPLAASLSVAWEVGKLLFDLAKDFIGGVAKDVVSAFSDLVGKGNEGVTVFTVLGGVVKTVGIGFVIIGKSIKLVIDLLVNIVKVVGSAAKVLQNLGAALAAPFDASKWKTAAASVSEAVGAIATLGITAFTDVKDLVVSTIKEFSTFGADSTKIGEKLNEVFTKASATMTESFAKTRSEATATTDAVTGLSESVDKASGSVVEFNSACVATEMLDLGVSFNAWSLELDRLSNKMSLFDGSIKVLAKDVRSSVAVFGLFSQAAKESLDALTTKVASVVGDFVSFWSNAVSQVAGLFSQYYDEQLTQLDTQYERDKQHIEDTITDETAKKKALEKLEKDYEEKKRTIQRDAWEAQHTADIVNAVAAGVVAVMQAYATLGWPLGLVPAAIMAAIATAQVAIISGQQNPYAAAEGGTFSRGDTVLVGERGPELVRFGQTGTVIPTEQSFGGSSVKQENNFYGDINSDVDLDRASTIQASRLRRALRS